MNIMPLNELSREAARLNQRFETNKKNPAWSCHDLQLLITATHDIYDLIRTYDQDMSQVVFAHAIPRPLFDQDKD